MSTGKLFYLSGHLLRKTLVNIKPKDKSVEIFLHCMNPSGYKQKPMNPEFILPYTSPNKMRNNPTNRFDERFYSSLCRFLITQFQTFFL